MSTIHLNNFFFTKINPQENKMLKKNVIIFKLGMDIVNKFT